MPKEVYHAYGYVKKAAAIVNASTGRLPQWKADLIARVADEVISGRLDNEFPLYVWQTGEIVEHAKKAPSTISWHLKRLKEAGIISFQHGQYHLYHIIDREMVAELLRKYKEIYYKVVDTYTETIEEL